MKIQPWTNNFIKIPFKEKGRDWDGADCWGLARIIYKERLGIELPVLNGYEHIKDRKAMCEIIKTECANWIEIPKGQEQKYDIAVFSMAGLPMHVGVVVRPGDMIHCQKGSGTTVVSYLDQLWDKRFEGFYRYAEGTSDTSAVSPSS